MHTIQPAQPPGQRFAAASAAAGWPRFEVRYVSGARPQFLLKVRERWVGISARQLVSQQRFRAFCLQWLRVCPRALLPEAYRAYINRLAAEAQDSPP